VSLICRLDRAPLADGTSRLTGALTMDALSERWSGSGKGRKLGGGMVGV
jgi:hypothetical protein